MFKKVKPNESVRSLITQFPHCDQRVLHAPGECQFCDKHPEWQGLRLAWGIAFTNYEPDEKELPCPANYVRGDAVNRWYGNAASNHKTCVFCGASSGSQTPCTSPANTMKPDTVGNRHHAFFAGTTTLTYTAEKEAG